MRELPRQYLDNMTADEWFNYNISIGVIPTNTRDYLKDYLKEEIALIENQFDWDYQDELVQVEDRGYDRGYSEAIMEARCEGSY